MRVDCGVTIPWKSHANPGRLASVRVSLDTAKETRTSGLHCHSDVRNNQLTTAHSTKSWFSDTASKQH